MEGKYLCECRRCDVKKMKELWGRTVVPICKTRLAFRTTMGRFEYTKIFERFPTIPYSIVQDPNGGQWKTPCTILFYPNGRDPRPLIEFLRIEQYMGKGLLILDDC
jgi:hypothetical protein